MQRLFRPSHCITIATGNVLGLCHSGLCNERERSSVWKTIVVDMVPISAVFPHPDAAKFAIVQAELGRLFILHKGDLGLIDWTDRQIVERVGDICAALIGCGQVALQRGDEAWLQRHAWASEAFARLFNDQPATTLDG